MKLKVFEYAQAVLPTLFVENKSVLKDNYYYNPYCRFDLNLCHNDVAVRRDIDNINNVSEGYDVIRQFKQIEVLLKKTELRGMDINNISYFWFNLEKFIRYDLWGYEKGLVNANEKMQDQIKENYNHYRLKNSELMDYAIDKARQLLIERDVYLSILFDRICIMF